MLGNYLKIALKVLARRKFFTFISLFGISFTLLVLMVITAMVDNALAPAPPESRLDRTLHVFRMIMRGDRASIHGDPGYAFLDRYVRDIPGVERMAIMSTPRSVTSFVNGEKVTSRLMRAESQYWEILDFEFLEGGPFIAADDRSGNHLAVISEAARQRFFGGEPALDRTIECDAQRFRVIGVVKSVPMTRLAAAADIWVPIGTTPTPEVLDQLMGDHYALLLAESRADFPRINSEFRSRLAHVEFPDPERFHTMLGVPATRLEMLAAEGGGTNERGEPRTREAMLLIMAAILAFLLLPTVNLISINMSRILERASEIGVRKAFGASAAHLVGQFIFENILLSLIGGGVALLAAVGVLALINQSGLIPHANFELNVRVFAYALALAIFFGFLSGVYPAWRMSRLHPVEALRGGAR